MTTNQSLQTKIIGHSQAKAQISQLLQNNKLPHALLLSGPSQIGKTSLLVDLAETMLGPEFNELNCQVFNESGSFKIEAVRKIQHQAHLTTSASHRIFIIKNIERMTIPASNALLKLLEEPPEKVKFFLSTSSESDLLPTIKSRCQILHLNNLAPEELTEFAQAQLDNHKIDEHELILSLGKPGRLANLINNSDFRNQTNSWYQELVDLDDFNLNHHHFLLTKSLSDLKNRSLIIEFLITYQAYLSSQLKHHTKVNTAHWAHKQRLIQQTINAIQSNQNPQLCLEELFISSQV